MKCAICFEEIYMPYYKSPSCNCNIYYHLNCIEKWYNINKSCIICKKKDEFSLNKLRKIHNKIYEFTFNVFLIILLLLLFFIIYLYKIN